MLRQGIWIIFMCSIIIISFIFKKLHTSVLDYSRKKTGLRIWNFQGYERNNNWVYIVLIKSNEEVPGVIMKKSFRISSDLGFRPQDLCGVTQFCGISRGEGLFCLEFRGKGSIRGTTPAWWGAKTPLLRHSQHLCCKYIIKHGENPQPYSIL